MNLQGMAAHSYCGVLGFASVGRDNEPYGGDNDCHQYQWGRSDQNDAFRQGGWYREEEKNRQDVELDVI